MKVSPALLAALAASATAAVVSDRLASGDEPPQCPVPAIAASTPGEPYEWLTKAVPWLPAPAPAPKPCGPCGMG